MTQCVNCTSFGAQHRKTVKANNNRRRARARAYTHVCFKYVMKMIMLDSYLKSFACRATPLALQLHRRPRAPLRRTGRNGYGSVCVTRCWSHAGRTCRRKKIAHNLFDLRRERCCDAAMTACIKCTTTHDNTLKYSGASFIS